MKRLCICCCAVGLMLCLIVAALPHFSAFADDNSLISVSTSSSNNSASVPAESTYSSTFTYPVSPFTSVCSGSHNRINSFSIRADGITSSTIFIRVDFTVVAVKSQGMQSASISDLFPVSVNGYNSNHTVPVTISDSDYSVRCYQYLMGQYLGDFGDIWISGVTEQYVVRGNKTLSFLIEIQAPATGTGNGLTITLNNPVSMYHTLNREDTLYLIPTHISQYIDSSEALFSYLVSIRNDVDQAEFDLAGIWQFLVDHASYLDNLQYIDDILAELTTDTNGYIYKILDYVQLTRWYVSLIVASNYQVRYLDANGELATRNGRFWDSIIAELQLLNIDFVKSYQYQNTVDDMSTDTDNGENSLEMALDAVSDANSIGSITGFLSIFNIAENDPEALTTHGTSGLLYWFMQETYDDIQQVPIPRGPHDDDGWVMPYTDKVIRMIEDLEGGG